MLGLRAQKRYTKRQLKTSYESTSIAHTCVIPARGKIKPDPGSCTNLLPLSRVFLFIHILHSPVYSHSCPFIQATEQKKRGGGGIYECMYVGSCCHGNGSPDTIFTNRDSPCACVCRVGEKNALWSGMGYRKMSQRRSYPSFFFFFCACVFIYLFEFPINHEQGRNNSFWSPQQGRALFCMGPSII